MSEQRRYFCIKCQDLKPENEFLPSVCAGMLSPYCVDCENEEIGRGFPWPYHVNEEALKANYLEFRIKVEVRGNASFIIGPNRKNKS